MARGKTRGSRRGGGHTFSRDLELDENGVAVSTGRDKRFTKRRDEDDDEEVEEEESTEEESDDDAGPSVSTPSASAAPGETMSRAERKALKQAAKKKPNGEEKDEDEDADLINPNRSLQTSSGTPDLSAPRELSRREREAKEKKEAAERYRKLHAAGKTVEAKADLTRLAQIRKEREAAAAKRKAEQEAKQAELDAKIASKQKR